MDFTQSSDIFLINWPQHHAFCSSVNFPLAPAQPCVAMLRVIDLNSSTWYFLSFWSFNVTILFTELVIHSRGVKSCPHWKSRKKSKNVEILRVFFLFSLLLPRPHHYLVNLGYFAKMSQNDRVSAKKVPKSGENDSLFPPMKIPSLGHSSAFWASP